jgi:hypothetical protein
MYTFGQIRRGVSRGADSPSYFARELNRNYHRRLGRWDYNRNGVDVMAEDWDTLLILDACRYDLFAAQHDLPGRLEHRESRGSHTVEFLEGNFTDGEFADTVYVSASPQLHRNMDRLDVSFHSVVDVWREDGWDDEYGTVLPETATEYALRAHDRYPNKRLIVHYLQPHYPFIGSSSALNTRRFGQAENELDIWNHMMRNGHDRPPERIWEAYGRNLDLVLEATEPLLSSLDGKTVVTADHGNMIGDRSYPIPIREWGHPVGIYTEQLVKVPWHVYESGPRRRIVAEEAESSADEVEGTAVERRLRDLGYA